MMELRYAAQRLLLGSFLAFPCAAYAGEAVTAGAVATADTGYSSNPFSEVGTGTGSGFVEIQASPEIDITSEKSVLALVGTFQDRKYFTHYNDTYDYSGSVDYKGTPSALIQTHIGAKYDNSIIGQNNTIFANSVGPVLSGSDLALFGTRERVQRSQANGDIKFVLSAKDSLNFSSYYLINRYEQTYAISDYDGYGGSAGYSRQVTANVQIGIQGSAARYVYRFLPGVNTTVYSPQVTFSDALNAYWKIQGAIGVSFVDRGASGKTTTFSGNTDLCYSNGRSDFCLTAQRAVLPTGSSGTQNEILAGVKYSYKINSRDTISTNASYTKNSAAAISLIPSSAFLRGDATYRHALTEKIDLTFQAKYAHIIESSLGRSADYGGQFGISVKVGSLHAR